MASLRHKGVTYKLPKGMSISRLHSGFYLQIGEQGMSIDKMTDDEILQIISGTMKEDDIMSLWKSIFDRGLIYARKSGEWEIEEYGTWIKSPSYTGGV